MGFRFIFVFLLCVFTGGAYAQSANQVNQRVDQLDNRLQALEEKQKGETKALTDELARLKTQSSIPELSPSESFMGMGAAASKVYFSKNPLSIGGYGEMVYVDRRGGSANTTDLYRIVPYLSYRFSDKIIFNSEIEFEHVKEVGVEFAYVDFLAFEHLGIRTGHVLVPVGISNLKHEPTYFASVLRPEVETNLIPSTWHDNGVLIFGEAAGVRYQGGVLNGLMSNTTDMRSSSWIRGARQWESGSAAEAEDLAYVARADWIGTPGFEVGASFYTGDSAQSTTSLGSARVQLWEVHSEWEGHGFEADALYTQGTLSDADKLSTVGNVIGSRAQGYYATLGYDWLTGRSKDKAIVTFARYSEYDLHDKVPVGFVKDERLDKKIWTLGLNYKPHPQVVVKGDFEFRKSKAGEDDDKFALGLGFIF